MATSQNPGTEYLSALSPLADKVAMEAVFAEVGKDNGILPLNSLFEQMHEAVASAPETVQEGVQLARNWIDSVLNTTTLFDAAGIAWLNRWVTWIQAAIEAGKVGKPIPDPKPATTRVSAPLPAPSGDQKPAAPTQAAAEMELLLNLEDDSELLREFINESNEHLQNIEQGVLVLEESPTDADTLDSIFRAFHTFKGGSGFLNLTPINRLAHELESLLDLARQHKLRITSEIINLILKGGDTLKQFVTRIEDQVNRQGKPTPILIPIEQTLSRIRNILERTSTPESAPVVEERSSHPTAIATGDSGEKREATELPEAGAAGRTSNNISSVKVDTQKLDSLVDLVGEMVIAQSLVAQDPAISRVLNQNLTRNLAQMARITKELQRMAMSLRMVAIRPTFVKMNRLIRDTAAKVGKQIELVLEGEETELDRRIVEEISDPLVHMIRNSVDHGIEKPDVRVGAGKPPLGRIWLRAFHQGGNFVIQIQDDGAGLNRDRILAKAIEKGLIKPGETLPDKKIYELIFAPGFSTAEKVTDLSGRGVGMDVVRRNIDKLRGKIEIESHPGLGSTFSIYLPLTLAIIEGLIVGVGDERYILPTLSIRESFRPTPNMISTLHERGEMVNVRGRLTPLLRLHEFFDVVPKTRQTGESIIVVIEAGEESRCLLVDQLIGKQEVVIKSLGESFKQNQSLAGAAILGDGRVGLILDPEALVHLRNGPISLAA